MNSIHSAFDCALRAESEGRYTEAADLFEVCLGQGEYDEGEVLFHCGWCTEQGRTDGREDALGYYERASAITQVPDSKLNCFFRAGWLWMQQKEYAKAATRFRNAIDYAEVSHHKNELYHQSAFWYAVCLESQGWPVEAIRWYRKVRLLSPVLDPECRYRELACLNQIGSYDEALALCSTFEASPPTVFNPRRYDELRTAISREREMLQVCLSQRSTFKMTAGHHGII